MAHVDDTTAEAPGAGHADPDRVLVFLRIAGLLKDLERTGWVNVGVHKPESVSDHMYRVAVACFLIMDEAPELDYARYGLADGLASLRQS